MSSIKRYIQVIVLLVENKADRQSEDKGWAEHSVFHTSNLTL